MNTRALILAAGRGSRMGSATDNNPKCLTVLSGKPLLQWQVGALRKAGVDEITVVGGYKSEMLTGDFSVVNNERWAETNMVASLFCAPAFDGDTIVSYSDIVYSPAHISALAGSTGAGISITADTEWYHLWSQRFEDPLDDAETFKAENNILIEIGGKTKDLAEIQAQYMGLIKFTSGGWRKTYQVYNALPQIRKDKLDMTSLLAIMLKEMPIAVVPVKGGWCEVDNYNDVLTYEKALKTNASWPHDWR